MSGVMGRGFSVWDEEWVYGEVIGRDVILVDGEKVEVYEDSVGLRWANTVREFNHVYEGDHVVVIHGVTESTPMNWRGLDEAVRYGVVVCEDGEFDIDLGNGELMDVDLLFEELAESGLGFRMVADRNEYELSRSYYEVRVRGHVFGERDGVSFDEELEELELSYRNEDFVVEDLYALLVEVLNEAGAEVPDVDRYRIVTIYPNAVTICDEEDVLYYSVSFDVNRLGYSYEFERYQENGYMIMSDLGFDEYVKNRLAKY